MNTWAPLYCNRYTPYPWYCATVSQKSQKFRVRVWGSYTERTEIPGTVRECCRTHRSSRYCDTGLQNSQKLYMVKMIPGIPVPRGFVALVYRMSGSSGYGYECRTGLTEVPGTGMNVLQNLQKFFVEVNTPGMVCTYPTEHNRVKISLI